MGKFRSLSLIGPFSTNKDTKLRNLLVENGPIRDNGLNFTIDKDSRNFSTTFYF